MSLRIGLSVASDSVRAVGVRAGDVLWAIQAERSLTDDLYADIVKLLRHATLPKWPRASVMAAIGPSASQTKLLSGLPAIVDVNALHSIVRASDPFGLIVKCANSACCALWNRLVALAKTAMNSGDERVAAGRSLNSTLTDIYTSKNVLNLDVSKRNFLSNLLDGGASTDHKVGEFGVGAVVEIDPTYTKNKFGMSNDVTLAHELGHAHGLMMGEDATSGVEVENQARTIKDCTPRASEGTAPPACQ